MDKPAEPQISVIVPVYNAEYFLRDTIDSIVNQSFEDFELLLIDDGSMDNSLGICYSSQGIDKRIRVFHQSNSGVSVARNKGLDEARGKFVVFVDSDDWLDKDFLKTYVEELQNCPKDTLIYQGLINEYGDRSEKLLLPRVEANLGNTLDALYVVEWLQCLGGACNKIFDLEIIQKNQIRFNPQLSFGEDKIFTLQYCRHISAVSLLDTCLYHYRRAAHGSLSTSYHHPEMLGLLMNMEYTLFNELPDITQNKRMLAAVNGRFLSMQKYILLSMYRKYFQIPKEKRLSQIKYLQSFEKENTFNEDFDRDTPILVKKFYRYDWLLSGLMYMKTKFSGFYKLLMR